MTKKKEEVIDYMPITNGVTEDIEEISEDVEDISEDTGEILKRIDNNQKEQSKLLEQLIATKKAVWIVILLWLIDKIVMWYIVKCL